MDKDTLTAAQAAGWCVADLEWECRQETAATFAVAGDRRDAERYWRECLTLAQSHFSADDPRLGTSLANVAAIPDHADAKKLLATAKEIWQLSPLWIDKMRVEQRARSSLHHLRLERHNHRVYQSNARRQLQDIAAMARALLAGEIRRTMGEQLAQWRKEKPPVFGDSRKLLSAGFLLAVE